MPTFANYWLILVNFTWLFHFFHLCLGFFDFRKELGFFLFSILFFLRNITNKCKNRRVTGFLDTSRHKSCIYEPIRIFLDNLYLQQIDSRKKSTIYTIHRKLWASISIQDTFFKRMNSIRIHHFSSELEKTKFIERKKRKTKSKKKNSRHTPSSRPHALNWSENDRGKSKPPSGGFFSQ